MIEPRPDLGPADPVPVAGPQVADGGGHAHSHGPAPAATRHTRRIVTAVLVPCAVATLIALIVMWPSKIKTPPDTAGGQRALGTVTALAVAACPPAAQPSGGQPSGGQSSGGQSSGGQSSSGQPNAGPQQRCGTATVRVTNGPGTGTLQTVDLQQGPGAPTLDIGTKVVLLYYPDAVPGGRPYSVVDQQRSTPMIWLLALSAAVILAFGRWRGLRSLAGLAVSFAFLLLFVIPAILHGSPPLLVAVGGSSAIMFAAMYLTQGINVHTSVAVAGTLVSLVLTGVLGAGFTSFMHLTGVGDDASSSLQATFGSIDLRGLLLAGIVIGALGVLDDVTVTQAITVAEMAGGHESRWNLYRAASRVGRAHVASAVNTIILAYAGTSLPLLLLIASSSEPIGDLLTSEFLAQEILRSAVGTIGLVASVPITTGLATLVADLRPAATATARHARP